MAAIKSIGESVCLEIVHSIYKNKVEYEQMPEGDLFPVKKEVLQKQIRVRKWFKKEAITSVEEHVTVKNTIAKNRSVVFDKYSARFYVTYHRPEDILNYIDAQPYKNPIGFTYDTEIHTTRSQIHQHKKRR